MYIASFPNTRIILSLKKLNMDVAGHMVLAHRKFPLLSYSARNSMFRRLTLHTGRANTPVPGSTSRLLLPPPANSPQMQIRSCGPVVTERSLTAVEVLGCTIPFTHTSEPVIGSYFPKKPL